MAEEEAQLPKPPEADYIGELNENLKVFWQTQMEDDEEAIQVINQEHKVDVPKPKMPDFKPIIYKSGTAQDALDRYAGLLARPILKAEPGWGSLAQDRAENAEQFFNLIFWDYETRDGPFVADLKDDVLGTGRGFIEVYPKAVLWTEDYGYPVRGKGEDEEGKPVSDKESEEEFQERLERWKRRISNPPIVYNYLPSGTVRVLLSKNRVIEYVQEVEMLLAEALERWPDKLADWTDETAENPKKRASEKVTALKYGDKHYISVVIKRGRSTKTQKDLRKVSDYAHGMGVCPLALFEGFKSAKKEPGRRWRSIVKKALSAIKTIDELRSRQATAIKMMPMAQYYFLVDKDSFTRAGEKEPPPVTIDPTEIKRFWSDQQPGVLEPSRPPPEAEALDSKVRDEIEWLLPEIARGMTGAAGTPAWSDRLKLDQVRNYLKPVVEGMAQGWRQVAQLTCKAIMSPSINETVYVRKHGLKGEMAIGLGPKEAAAAHDRITAFIQTKIPSDRNADIGMAQMAYDFGMPWSWCVEEFFGVENPMEQKKRRILEEVEDSEEYRSRLRADILTEADLLEAQEAALSPEELAGAMPGLPGSAQEAVGMATGTPGPAPAPPGAGPGSIQKTGQLPGGITGPNPNAPFPGGPM